jgi:GT2 family glycosyltransferase
VNETAASAADVCVGIVTYGSRAALCCEVVTAVLAEGVSRVIIVDNGSSQCSRQLLASLAADKPDRVELVRSERNRGSAGGFALALASFLDDGRSSHIWLLDDDNRPVAGALNALLQVQFASRGEVALLSYRGDRQQQRRVVALARPADEVYPARSSFLHVNVRNTGHRLRRARCAAPPRTEPVSVPYGPYGGLLISRDLVERSGLPREDLVLYEDDTDFTLRVRRSGAGLLLVPQSRIEDIDTSWSMVEQAGSGLTRMLTSPESARVYYSTRNRVYFESRYWRSRRWLYLLNKSIVLGILTVLAVRYGRMKRLAAIFGAIRDGERGRLGEVQGVNS